MAATVITIICLSICLLAVILLLAGTIFGMIDQYLSDLDDRRGGR